jgi:predicted transcriptional regulator
MPFYYIISSSVSIQTLILLSDKNSQTCSISELKDTFASPKIVSYKLKSMENSGVLLNHGEAYKTTSKGKLIAKSFGFIKRLWNLGPGG